MTSTPITAATASVLEAELRWLCRVFDCEVYLTFTEGGVNCITMGLGRFWRVGRMELANGAVAEERQQPNVPE